MFTLYHFKKYFIMSQSLIDIYNNMLEHDKNQIIIIIDDKLMPWFSAVDIAKNLEYIGKEEVIINHVYDEDKKIFDELKIFVKEILLNIQPNTFYQ
jgi:prophage antirepressor-like protein